MSKFTDFLNLFMWDSIEDSEEEFNIDKALNDNWKKIDTKVKTHVTSVNEEINNFKEETNQKIENIQALPTGGTKGQVLTKQSETNGDANWEDIEANEVFVGNEEEAPSSAKIIIEDEDFEESAGLSKAEVYVGAEEPTTGEKVWFRKGKNLFNKNVSIITGYYLDNKGSLVSNEDSWYQNVFIEVNSKTQYTISSTVAVLRICFYDKDRKFISRVVTENTSVTFSTPENCKYVRLSGDFGDNADTQVQSLQLEQGSKATSYEAYIEPKIYVRNSNGVYEEFAKKSEGLVDYTSYIEFNDKVTEIYNCTAYKKDNILFLNIDLEGNFPEGETVIGTIKRKLKLTAFGSGRLKTTNNKVIPATYIGLSERAFRVHTTTTGTATAGNIILALED